MSGGNSSVQTTGGDGNGRVKFLEEMRETLEAERASILERTSIKSPLRQAVRMNGDPDGHYPESLACASTLEMNGGMSSTLLGMETEELQRIDAALERVENGTIEACVVCDGNIRRARLRAMPYTDVCIACKSGMEEGAAQGDQPSLRQ